MEQKAGILLTGFVMMSDMGISPVPASIAEEFPAVSQSPIRMILMLPSLRMGAQGHLYCGWQRVLDKAENSGYCIEENMVFSKGY